MEFQKDIIWNEITESAKTRLDFKNLFGAADSEQEENLHDNILFMCIAGYAVGRSESEIINSVNQELCLLGILLPDDFDQFLKDQISNLTLEIKATRIAVESFDMGLQGPGVLVAVRKILKQQGMEKPERSTGSPGISQEELQGYAEELFRRAIATTLKIRPSVLKTSPEKQELVEHCLRSVIAIGSHPTLEAAAEYLVESNDLVGTSFTMDEAIAHVNEVYDKFPLPIAGVERMLEMRKHPVELKDIWDFLRCRIRISPEHDDDWMRTVDMWILHGQKHQG